MGNNKNTNKIKPTIGSIFLIVLGIHFLGQFFMGIYAQSNPEFLVWLKFLGIVMVLHGTVSLIKIRWNAHQAFLFWGKNVINMLYITLLIWLSRHTEIIPVLSLNNAQPSIMPKNETINQVLQWIIIAFIVLILIDFFISIYTNLFKDEK